MNKYTIYCTAEQTKKAFELGAPLFRYTSIPNFAEVIEISTSEYYEIPTAEQMIGWLRSQGVKFLLSDEPDSEGCYWFIGNGEECIACGKENENKELAAIDAALECLINNDSIR